MEKQRKHLESNRYQQQHHLPEGNQVKQEEELMRMLSILLV